MYLLNLAWISGASALPIGVSTPPKWSINVPICLRNLKKNLVHGALIEAEILTSPLPMYLLNLAWFLGTSTLPTGGSTPPKWSRNVPMCLRNLQKVFVHGTLIEAEILTYQLPMYLLNLAWFLGTSTLPTGGSTPPKWSRNVSMCLKNLQKVFVHGALIEAQILTSPSPMYLLNLAQLWALTLCLQVCQHLPSGLQMFLCVSETSKPNLVHGALMEAKILTSPLPHAFAQLGLVLCTGNLPMGVSTPPKQSRNVPMCLRNLQKVFGAWGPNRSWDIDPPSPCICSTWASFGC